MSATTKVVRGASTLAESGPQTARVTSRFEDLITAVLGTCMVGGLLTDAWAHTNIVNQLESFFTPWHAMLYGGFAATAAWTFWLGFRRRHGVPRWWRNAWPAGYAVGALGAALFLVAGFGDMIWHQVLGIEATLDAALSPTHLVLATGATLLLTSPLRSWWANGAGRDRAATGVWSLAIALPVALVLVGFSSVLQSLAPTHTYDHVMNSPSHFEAAFGLAKYVLMTAFFVTALLLVHHPVAGQARQHHVEDHRVVPAVARQLQPGRPVTGHVHGEALGGQAALQRLGQPSLVLHHQQPHAV